MLNKKFRRILRTGAAAFCIAVIGCTSTLVYAEPSTGVLEQKASGLQGELNNLNQELDTLCREIDSTSEKIESMTAAMQESQRKMNEAQQKGEKQYEAMKLRIKYMYESGNHSFIELLCSSESMADLLNKGDFIRDVSEYDRDMLQELLDIQNEMEKEGDTVAKQQEELLQLEEELRLKRTALESKISSASNELSQYQAQLDKARQAEQMNGSAPDSVLPDNVTPGQSLGSFRITHYCPCYYCSGGWGNGTATGTTATPGRTIAVDPRVIPYGTVVIINGRTYVAEDCGGAIKGNKIDIYVPDHAAALRLGAYYTEVYLAK